MNRRELLQGVAAIAVGGTTWLAIVPVNAFTAPEVNAISGVVGTDFRHLMALPRDGEVIQTVEFRANV
jgi:hypothetical protein